MFEIKWNRSDFIECYNNFIEEYSVYTSTFLGCLVMAEIQASLDPIDGDWLLAMEEITV